MVDLHQRWRLLRYRGLVVIALTASANLAAAAQQQSAPTHQIDFARDIQPLLAKPCYECHGPKKQESGFRLDDRASALAGGDLGHDIVPGRSGESRLVSALEGTSEAVSRMPADRDPLPADQIALVRDWIDQGALWTEAPKAVSKDSRSHWAFRAPLRPVVPPVKNADWPRGDIVRFILAKL